MPVETSTRVVFLQHPRESRVAIGTARIAHLGLLGSELHEGIDFSRHSRVTEWINRPGTALLFPGEGSTEPQALARTPETLLVIDGTWPQARKVLALNPALRALPRIGFVPQRPGNYRIRREPAEHCVATVEAVVEVLAALEGHADRFQPLLRAFESMVDRQIAAKAARTEPVRHHLAPPAPWWKSKAMPDLNAAWPHLVVLAAEANAHLRGSGVPGLPEIIQLGAIRLETGDSFHAFLAPRRPLAAGAPHHLEVSREDLIGGEAVDRVLERWRAFIRPQDRLVGWGSFGWELLAQEGWRPSRDPIDLRLVAAHRLKRRPGAPATAAAAIGGDGQCFALLPGRAGQALRSIAAFTAQLVEEQRAGTAPS